MRKPITLLLLGLVASLSNAEDQTAVPAGLPKNILPERYLIHLEPDLDHLVTSGSESIEIRIVAATKRIVMHAAEIEISGARIVYEGNQEELTPQYDAATQTVAFETREVLEPGGYTLGLTFKSRILDIPAGLFLELCPGQGEKERILATCMKPANARKVFPCWDDPGIRAVYQLSVRTRSVFTTVSNTPVFAEQAIGTDEKIVVFEATPPVSSDLLMLVSGRFELLEDEIPGVKLRVLTPPGKRELGRLGIEVTKRVLAYYDSYCGVRFGLSKLDQIALPEAGPDAIAGWGVIIYPEESLLFDPENNSEADSETLFAAVANALARQWFGGLFTARSQGDRWLTEAFAHWMQMKACEQLHPEWKPWLEATAERETAMNLDTRTDARAIRFAAANADQSSGATYPVVCQKGQLLLRMLEGFFGQAAFRSAVQMLLGPQQPGGAAVSDFTEALEKSSGRQAAKIVSNWVDQAGFPLVRVTTQCIAQKRVISLEQVRFSTATHVENLEQWSIPVGIFSSSGPGDIRYAVLEKLSNNFDFPGCDGSLKANAGGLGYFRVLYEPALYSDLLSNLFRLPEGDRINLLADTWAFVESGNIEASSYFGMLDNLSQDNSFGLWKSTLGSASSMGALKIIDRLEQGQPGRANYQKYICGIFGPKLRAWGWDQKKGEDAETRRMRALLIETLGFFGDREVIDEAFKRFEIFRQNPATLTPDLRAPVLFVVGRYSSESTYEELLSQISGASTKEEERLLLRAAAATLDPALAGRTLHYLMTEDLPAQMAAGTFENLCAEGEHPQITWEFLKEHVDELQRRFGESRLRRIMSAGASGFADEVHAVQITDFFKDHLFSGSRELSESAAESIRLRAKLKARELPVIDKWIETKAGAIAHSGG